MRPRLHLLAAALLVAGCSHDSTAPLKPASISSLPTTPLAGKVNAVLTPAPTVVVKDASGQVVSDVPITVTVTAGGGTISGAPTKSTNGNVSIGSWTLGPTPGVNTLTISAAGVPSITINATARPPYYVEIRFFGPAVDPAIQAAFTAAANRVQSIIVGNLPDVVVTTPLDINSCFPSFAAGLPPVQNETLDDIVIFATVRPIDGPGKVLGSSGPCYQRTGSGSSGLPIIAAMTFDSADLPGLVLDGRITDVITHEMLHTLGFGIMWADMRLTANGGTATSAFVGTTAIAGCLFHGGAAVCNGGVPEENIGIVGDGTRDVHWRESTFKTELMTGFVSNPGVPNPLSRITIGSMADMGYTVNLNAADAYSVPTAAALSTSPGSGVASRSELREVILLPKFAITRTGQVTPLVPKR